ncbi:MAG: copper homeostasis protein CutC [Bacteroidia bacterium]|nr:copper homeostasis protein CutC [Bacteroidia bacterium]
MNRKLEIACFNAESALVAQQAGADRIEFCANMEVGGTTPSLSDFLTIKSKTDIPVYVMIRPRGGDFVYSNAHFEQMRNSIIQFKNAGANGFVFGILTVNGEVDVNRNKQLIQLADAVPCTFHKAFDEVKNPIVALQQIIAIGFKNVLTSGQQSTAMQGVDLLKQLTNNANNQINIMIGGSVRSTNIEELKQEIPSKWYHSSAILKGNIADYDEVKNLKAKLV